LSTSRLPIPTTRPNAAFVRLYLDKPGEPRRYYNADKAIWVGKDEPYRIWKMADWEGTFGAGSKLGRPGQLSATEWLDGEGRHWEFFGYVIPLYDDNEKS
jgi:hypothetical protein